MMFTIVCENIAARSKRSPRDLILLKCADQRRCLLFRIWRHYPIDGAANPQACELSESSSAFGAHADVLCDPLNRCVSS
jgi:hypothetical protein